jgi:hypothetical protein
MRLSVATQRRLVKGDLRIEFVRQELTRTAGSNCSGGMCGTSTCQCAGREILIDDISPRTRVRRHIGLVEVL